MQHHIYVIRHRASGKAYVGKTKHLQKRWKQHQKLHSKTCRYLHAAMTKYGASSFDFEAVEACDEKDAAAREIHWINQLNTLAPKGYNLTLGGEGGSLHEETRARLSAALRGKPRTEATKARIRAGHVGRVVDDQGRANMSASRQGEQNHRFGKPKACCKLVAQYSREGVIVATHNGMTAAVRAIENNPMLTAKQTIRQAANIRCCIYGKSSHAYGFVWQYV